MVECLYWFYFLFYMTMKENYIDSYLEYLQYSRGFSYRTVEEYKKALTRFDNYLKDIDKTIKNPTDIVLMDALKFFENLSKSWWCAASVANALKSVRSYLKYCRNILELDVIDPYKIPYPKSIHKEIWFYSEEDKKLILNLVNEWFWLRKITQMRNRLLVYMFFHTGLRIHEMAKIKVWEIWESLQIIGKGGKRRFVYLRRELLEMIDEYLSQRKKKSEYLFPSWFKEWWHITTDQIRHTFNKMSKKVWIHIHAHKFRHTFATDLLHVPWANIYNVSKLLGHSSILTTQIYLWVYNSELKNLQFWLNF